jgi:hypothetical protein
MKPKWVYLTLCFVGAILPYWQFVPWVRDHGLNLQLLVRGLFANRISGFFGLDAIVTAVVVIVFARVEGRRLRLGPSRWLPVAAVLTVGASLGLPLFLYLRELRAGRTSDAGA